MNIKYTGDISKQYFIHIECQEFSRDINHRHLSVPGGYLNLFTTHY